MFGNQTDSTSPPAPHPPTCPGTHSVPRERGLGAGEDQRDQRGRLRCGTTILQFR
jgi:hypothetical protein